MKNSIGILACFLYALTYIQPGTAAPIQTIHPLTEKCTTQATDYCTKQLFLSGVAYKECWLREVNLCYLGNAYSRYDLYCNSVEVTQTQELCWKDPSAPYNEECSTVEYTALVCLV